MSDERYIWGHDRRFNAYSSYIKNRFGSRIQKLSLDAGFTCPNRDGTLGKSGCSYCNNRSFNPSYCIPEKPIRQQLLEGIEFHKRRYRRATGYFAYFQAYSNTYASTDVLHELYSEALSVDGVLGLVIGTRPDCVDDGVISLLGEFSKKSYVALELGIESVYNKTLERVSRGHTFEVAQDAVRRAANAGIETGGHFIFGLPGESIDEMLGYADTISALPFTTVKFHQLQIIKGTPMEREFLEKPDDFQQFTWEEYRDFFISFLEQLSPDIVVERFTGEANPSLLAGKRWGNKRSSELMNIFEIHMQEIDTWQGKRYNGPTSRRGGER